MALDLYADCGLGQAPADAQQIDAHHPGRIAFEALGGTGPMWMRCNIPMGRGLGFSGAARVSAAALAAVQTAGADGIVDRGDEILACTAQLEGHGDNVAALTSRRRDWICAGRVRVHADRSDDGRSQLRRVGARRDDIDRQVPRGVELHG